LQSEGSDALRKKWLDEACKKAWELNTNIPYSGNQTQRHILSRLAYIHQHDKAEHMGNEDIIHAHCVWIQEHFEVRRILWQ
ncbi:MAG: hypothetical protein ACKPKO_18855, partial [Candidatus Fonsibacter sp.]